MKKKLMPILLGLSMVGLCLTGGCGKEKVVDGETSETADMSNSQDIVVDKDALVLGEYDLDKDNKKEGIEWICLDVQDDKALLLSKYVIDEIPFHEDVENPTMWDNSMIRKWLNTEFIDNSFSETEQNAILTSSISSREIESVYSPIQMIYTKEVATEDRIFLLSVADYLTYFPIEGYDYNGAYAHSVEGIADVLYETNQSHVITQENLEPISDIKEYTQDLIGAKGASWSLRDTSTRYSSVHDIDSLGAIYPSPISSLSGVRPAMWVDSTQINKVFEVPDYLKRDVHAVDFYNNAQYYAGQQMSEFSLGDVISDENGEMIVNVSKLRYAYFDREDVLNASIGDILIASDGVEYECKNVEAYALEATLYLYCPEYDKSYYANSVYDLDGYPERIPIGFEYDGTYETERLIDRSTFPAKVAPDAVFGADNAFCLLYEVTVTQPVETLTYYWHCEFDNIAKKRRWDTPRV